MQPVNLGVEKAGAIATVTVSRPDALNSLDLDTVDDLHRVFDRLGQDSDVGGVVLTGSGARAFVAGADIKQMAGLSPLEARDFSSRIHALCRGIERLGKPVVAAVNGAALGAGCELAMACHFRIASTRAVFGQPEVRLGLIAGGGGTRRLERLVGRGSALEMLLTGETIAAEDAHRIGLVSRIVAPEALLAECRSLLGRILKNAPLAVRYSLEAVYCGSELPPDEALCLEASLFGLCFASEDMREGTGAFIEKRSPQFRGR